MNTPLLDGIRKMAQDEAKPESLSLLSGGGALGVGGADRYRTLRPQKPTPRVAPRPLKKTASQERGVPDATGPYGRGLGPGGGRTGLLTAEDFDTHSMARQLLLLGDNDSGSTLYETFRKAYDKADRGDPSKYPIPDTYAFNAVNKHPIMVEARRKLSPGTKAVITGTGPGEGSWVFDIRDDAGGIDASRS